VFRSMITILLTGLASMSCQAEFRDPTQPAYPQQASADSDTVDSDNELVLSAIWISSHSRRATINGVSGKQGQTIVIEQALPLTLEPTAPTNTATTSDKQNELLHKAMEYAHAETVLPNQENILSSLGSISPLGNIIAPHVAAPTKSLDTPPLQKRNTMNTATGTRQQANTTQRLTTAHIPPRSITIKIVSIYKNSVVIDQNGELKTLQLVQRSYKTK